MFCFVCVFVFVVFLGKYKPRIFFFFFFFFLLAFFRTLIVIFDQLCYQLHTEPETRWPPTKY